MTEKQLSEVECSTLCGIYLNSKVTANLFFNVFFLLIFIADVYSHFFAAVLLVPHLNTFVQ